MNILGIWDGHDSGASIIKEGNIVKAVSEERLNRRKLYVGFPSESIKFILNHINKDEIDIIAIAGLEGLVADIEEDIQKLWTSGLGKLYCKFARFDFLLRNRLLNNLHISVIYKMRKSKIKKKLAKLGLNQKIVFIDHHQAHAYSAYKTIDFQDPLVVTVDGTGDGISATTNIVENEKLKRVQSSYTYDSPGWFYAAITNFLGFKIAQHEGKITGLAAYGDPEKTYSILKKFLTFSEVDENFRNTSKSIGQTTLNIFKKELKDFSREDISAGAQKVLEEAVTKYIYHFSKKYKKRNIVLAGGVFANVKLNQRIKELDSVDNIYIFPHMGDGGLAIGAALAVANSNPHKFDHVYWGNNYSEEEILKELNASKLSYKKLGNIEKEIANLLFKNKIVAIFNGPMECGPRALGNRSILYTPIDKSVNDWLNKQLSRSDFMPFAPVVLKEEVDKCFINFKGGDHAAKFMTITFNCTDWMKKNCPAVVHVDNTARPQVIEESINPYYFKILKEFKNLTGLPVLVNTSFNMHEEPIVCTPQDAIKAFIQSNMDYLAMGKYLVTNKNES